MRSRRLDHVSVFLLWRGKNMVAGREVHTACTRSFTPSSIAHAVSAVSNPQLAVAGGSCPLLAASSSAHRGISNVQVQVCLPACLPRPWVGGSRARNDIGG